ncbi:MAG: cation-translocating P-type ATPase, partial [Candidatus Woesearchaeota archaeon]
LSIGTKKMAKKNAILKRLPAVETLGTCTVICTDKTGTLTQNKMVIEYVATAREEISVSGVGFNPEGQFSIHHHVINPQRDKNLCKVIETGLLCNNSELVMKNNEWVIDGEPPEGALTVMAHKAGIRKADYLHHSHIIHENPFDSERKCMSTVYKHRKQQIVYVKGAPEIILAKCTRYYDKGRTYPMTKSVKNHLTSKIKEYSLQGFFVMGLGFKEHAGKSFSESKVESGLTFAGITAMRDPPEDGVGESIKMCQQAGIKVVMITGDNENTAMTLAKELGIYNEEKDDMLTGEMLDNMEDMAFREIVDSVTVYARVTPHHKLRVVEALQQKGHVVAMTGDGVNDAPALKKADIGVAMGRAGTEVAREAAEMVLKDDKFSTIASAVKQGRTIYTNIQKIIYYLFASNLSILSIILIAVIIGIVPPLTPLMILFVNLVTNDFPALGLCFERSTPHIMKQRPRDPKEGILNEYILLKIDQVIPLMILGTLIVYFWEVLFIGSDITKAQTMAFATVIMFGLFHVLNAKGLNESIFSSGLFTNPWIWVAIMLSLTSTALAIYWPPVQAIFGTVPLTLRDIGFVIIVTSTVFFFVEAQKLVTNAEIRERRKRRIVD